MNEKDTGLVSGLESECSDHEQLGQRPESRVQSQGRRVEEESVGCRYLSPVSPSWAA